MKFRFVVPMLILMASVVQGTASLEKRGESAPPETVPTEGCLRVLSDSGYVEVPLRHTDVRAKIAGFLAEVEVTQKFRNTFSDPIEAVYTFPLPENAAVHEMIMVIGSRNIHGEIKKRAEARMTYETAKRQGRRAALLEQERPNIFTQSLANIQPGEEILITINFVQALKYDRGVYNWHFPMVVGPRYNPPEVEDAVAISPPVLKPGRRNGHEISLAVELDAGVSFSDLRSLSHDVAIEEDGDRRATVRLKSSDSIPNKDFMLEYRVAGTMPGSALLAHKAQQGGYVMLMMQPSFRDVTENLTPKEVFFVIDCSGSMSGFPIQKVKEAMYWCIQGLSNADHFQIIRFDDSAENFSKAPIPATEIHKAEALDYIQALHGSGGTRMIEGVKACLDAPRMKGRQRIVFFMTDGYIGNDDEILAAIREKVGDARLFSFGVGSSVNRSLIEGMATTGNGTATVVRQDQPVEGVMREMMGRINRPYLTDLRLEATGIELTEILPKLPDLYSAQPLVVFARYEKPGRGTVRLRGTLAGRPWEESVAVTLPEWSPRNASLPLVWAREKIKQLTLEEIAGRQERVGEAITELALDFHLMSKYTSLVAVDDELPPGDTSTLPRTFRIPVPMPEGVSFTGIFGPPGRYDGDYVMYEMSEPVAGAFPGHAFANGGGSGYFTGIHGPGEFGTYGSGSAVRSLAAPAPPVSHQKNLPRTEAAEMVRERVRTAPYSVSDIVGDEEIYNSIFGTLPETVGTAEYIEAMNHSDGLTRWEALLRAEARFETMPLEIVAKALEDSEPSIRARGMMQAAARRNEPGFRALILRGTMDEDPGVVVRALAALEPRDFAENLAELREMALSHPDSRVRVQALGKLVAFPESSEFVRNEVLASGVYDDYPELLVGAVQLVRAKDPAAMLGIARNRIKVSGYGGRRYEDYRTALTEVLFEHGDADDRRSRVEALKRERSWKVRRAVLAGLARARDLENIGKAVAVATDDPHPVIRMLAGSLTTALTRPASERNRILGALAEDPTPATVFELAAMR